MKMLVASDMPLATSWKGRSKSIFSSSRDVQPTHPAGHLAGGAGAIHFRRAFESPGGEGRLRRPEPKKKDTTKVVSFFL